MIPDLTAAHWLTLHGLATSLAVLAYVISSHAMQQRRQPAAAIAWMLFILLLPYVALPAYLLFGSRKRARPVSRNAPPNHGGEAGWAVETILSLGQPAPAGYSDLHIHADGRQAREALLGTIDQALSSIDLCTFILGRDAVGQEVIDRLCTKAAQGVRVRVMLDGMGGLMERHASLTPLIRAGGEFASFAPPLGLPLKSRANLRDHRKLVVVDADLPSARLWCGGRNLAAEYFEGSPGMPPWRDLSFDLQGDLVQQARALFEQDWAFAKGMDAPEASIREVARSGGAQLVASGPDQADDTLLALLVTACYRARHRMALATPYFVPDPALLMALCLAARRGVTVDLLLPRRSNHRLSDLARGRALRTLAQAGGRVWLAPIMMHTKLVLVDDVLALAGSANLDSRSLLLNYELMVAFHQPADVRRFAAWLDLERRDASPYVAAKAGLLRDVAEGMLLWIGFQL